MSYQHRLAGGWADHAWVGHSLAEQRVDKRGFAGAGGAAEDGQQGSVQVGQARQDVVVQLIDNRVGLGSGVGRQCCGSNGVAHATHGLEDVGSLGIHPSHLGRVAPCRGG